MKKLIGNMVSDLDEDFHLAFRDREVLERSLYFHLKSAYYRIIYEVEFEKPMAKTIISHYPGLFLETKEVIYQRDNKL